ncbi:bifunctional UDP-sugar hydrolase/5'-nucleotidase [Niallia sp. XMNu-256]|uniref:bifunctional metallophosphatase/5'-nucleotidase n=1 Tax=Niallia sp. XMNu-256 TaxID=3082444 RepID=UPI0030CDE6F8
MGEVIHIYHTNDLHSHFDHWPRIQSFLQNRKKWHQEHGESCFLFDIGDHADRWHPLTEATMGQENTRLLNETGIQAVTIGNNEGITFPHDGLDHLYDHRQFDVLVANLFKLDGNHPSWIKEHAIYETTTGIKVGVTGLTANYEHLYRLLGWKVIDPIETLKVQIAQLKDKCDIIVLLSHLGIHEDEMIGREFPDIDVVIGGHTHHILHEGKMVNNSLLTCAGKYGMYVGHIRLSFDNGKLLEKKAWLYSTNELPVVQDEKNIVKNLYRKGKAMLSQNVVSLNHPFMSKEEIAVLLCEATKEWCQADCALINEGLILEDFQSGILTKFELLKNCPHPINPCVVELTGSELKEVLIQSLDEKWKEMQIIGLGFRGKVMGKMIYSGIEVQKGPHSYQFFIDGVLLQPNVTYKIAIPDMFTFGRFFPSIFRAKNKHYFLPEFMRHLLEWKLGETEKQSVH